MKPAPFEYCRAESAAHACELLSADNQARIIAGGQTLVPMLAMRLARPSKLVDVGRIAALNFIEDRSGSVEVGAVTCQAAIERSALIHEKLPLLGKAIRWVGHPPTRARGTIGGSLANADPAAEISLVAVTLQATLKVAEVSGFHEISAEDFFIGPMITSLPEGSCLTAVEFPVWTGAFVGTGFEEVNARSSDFAFVAACAQVELDADGACSRATLGLGGLADVPIRIDLEEIKARLADEASVRDAVCAAIEGVDPLADLHATAEYRSRVAVTLACRSVVSANRDAEGRFHAHRT